MTTVNKTSLNLDAIFLKETTRSEYIHLSIILFYSHKEIETFLLGIVKSSKKHSFVISTEPPCVWGQQYLLCTQGPLYLDSISVMLRFSLLSSQRKMWKNKQTPSEVTFVSKKHLVNERGQRRTATASSWREGASNRDRQGTEQRRRPVPVN